MTAQTRTIFLLREPAFLPHAEAVPDMCKIRSLMEIHTQNDITYIGRLIPMMYLLPTRFLALQTFVCSKKNSVQRHFPIPVTPRFAEMSPFKHDYTHYTLSLPGTTYSQHPPTLSSQNSPTRRRTALP